MRLTALLLFSVVQVFAEHDNAIAVIQRSSELQLSGHLTEAASMLRALLARPGLSPFVTGVALNELGLALHNRHQFDEAEPLYREALRILTTTPGIPPAYAMRAHMNMTALYVETNRRAEAERERSLVQTSLLTDVADLSQALSLTASLAMMRGDLDGASDAYRQTLEFVRKNGGPANSPQVATALNNLGTIAFRRGRWAEAEQYLWEAADTERRTSGDLHPNLMKVLTNVALAQMQQRRFREAGETLHEALNIARISLGDMHPVTATILEYYAKVLENTGFKKEAKAARNEAAHVRAEAPRPLPRNTTVDVSAFTRRVR